MNVNDVLEVKDFQQKRLRGTYSLACGLSHLPGRFVFRDSRDLILIHSKGEHS